jgi:diguanylate cyclase (GGDEF)-like protein
MMYDSVVDDARAAGPLERLLEECWEARSRRPSRRELLVETSAALVFLAIAIPLAIPAFASRGFDPGLALLLVGLYAVVSRAIKFPIGAGSVVPSYVVLVPMLLLLPPASVPLLAAASMVAGTLARIAVGRGTPEQALYSIPDAWHTIGPACVLLVAGSVHGGERLAAVYIAAFVAGCLIDLVMSTLREAAAVGVAPQIQLRVIAVVWLVDACLAPLGLLVAHGARHHPTELLMLLPLTALVVLMDRDRSARIAEAHRRLELVARERTRLQAAVRRLGEAFSAKLDLRALCGVVLNGSIDALGANAGQLVLHVPGSSSIYDTEGDAELKPLLDLAAGAVQSIRDAGQFERHGAWALALPIILGDNATGALVVARSDRPFRDDERALMHELVERAQGAAAEIVAHELLREQAVTDPLTQLGNRRKLADDLREQLAHVSAEEPLVLLLFDLDGFKTYNDTFGHPAGDALLARLGGKLAAAVGPRGNAYRLGGDEFCAMIPARTDELPNLVAAAASALDEHGETFVVRASCGVVILPHEAANADYALQLADKRMYARKHGRSSVARQQAADVLRHIMQAKQPGLPDHSNGVARLAVPVGRQFGLSSEQLDELARAAELHDVGKVGIPDAILDKPAPLDTEEWQYVRQHTVLGERILSAAPALRPVATIVRASHERWDGGGYPDGIKGEEIPLAARIVAVCDAYEAITSDRCYRRGRPPAAARRELIREAGRQFDPAVVTAFLNALDTPRVDEHQAVQAIEDERAELAAEVAGRVREMLQGSGDLAAQSWRDAA